MCGTLSKPKKIFTPDRVQNLWGLNEGNYNTKQMNPLKWDCNTSWRSHPCFHRVSPEWFSCGAWGHLRSPLAWPRPTQPNTPFAVSRRKEHTDSLPRPPRESMGGLIHCQVSSHFLSLSSKQMLIPEVPRVPRKRIKIGRPKLAIWW